MTTKELRSQALRLPAKDRAHLAAQLLVSLDEGAKGRHDAEWIEEAERRYSAYKKGILPGRFAAGALKKARFRIR
ncbi:MAG: addiction module protein [Planctomycetota bacterium]|nr:addiction module protein [Planctomycetota bacterium]